jgi:hypothetical protein
MTRLVRAGLHRDRRKPPIFSSRAGLPDGTFARGALVARRSPPCLRFVAGIGPAEVA